MQELEKALLLLDAVLDPGQLDNGDLTLADCVVFPSLYNIELVARQLGVDGAFGEARRALAYFEAGKRHPLLGAIYAESVADLPSD